MKNKLAALSSLALVFTLALTASCNSKKETTEAGKAAPGGNTPIVGGPNAPGVQGAVTATVLEGTWYSYCYPVTEGSQAIAWKFTGNKFSQKFLQFSDSECATLVNDAEGWTGTFKIGEGIATDMPETYKIDFEAADAVGAKDKWFDVFLIQEGKILYFPGQHGISDAQRATALNQDSPFQKAQ